jgi:amidase
MPFNSATEQLEALQHDEVTSLDLVEATIARIEEVDGNINAVAVRDFDRARQAAVDADRERAAGGHRPLLGVPVTVKEAFDVEGLPTTWGLPGTHPPACADSALVERLRAAGAIIVGKTNVAMMLGDWQTVNPVFGLTSNPWDTSRTPGGSSGGGAAAVATGMTAVDFGSDLAGSLRIPAAFCGVLAHRPSHGLVPMRGFAPPMAPRTAIVQSVDQATVGPIARHAADLRLALDVIAGPDTEYATAYRLALPAPRHRALREFRVLLLDTHPMVPTSSDIRRALTDLGNRLEREGCTVGRTVEEIPEMTDLTQTFAALLMSMLGVDTPEGSYAAASARSKKEGGNPQDRSMTMSHREWVWLDRHRLELSACWRKTFERWDVVACPVAPTTAFRHDKRPFEQRTIEVNGSHVGYDTVPLWAALATPCGLPATTVPLGYDSVGLPVGAQIIGPRFEDYTTLAFAELLDSALGFGFSAPRFPEAT